MTERGMQVKSDMNTAQGEHSEFPILCESCFGTNPYVRMQKQSNGGTCKMCDRPYTLFKWRPERGDSYKKTEICQTCSKIKNLCQTCILDLEYGLPSQLRDAVLAQGSGAMAMPESDVNREYFAAQHQQIVAQGTDPWSARETPHEKLLEIVRASGENREQPRVKLPGAAAKRDASMALSTEAAEEAAKYARKTIDLTELPFESHLPPGASSVLDLAAADVPEGFQPFVNVGVVPAIVATGPSKTTKKPPKPAGPPPPSAFLSNVKAT